MYFDVEFRGQNFLRGVDCYSPSRKLYFYFPRIYESTILPLSIGLNSQFVLGLKAQKCWLWTNGLTS